jgi:NADH-quinone oxidoreductase subunit L
MVTAGVYMIGRNAVLFSHAPMVMNIVAIVGVLTALMAASIGLVQYDIKKVLAYSTVSQLGYMFTAMGVGAFSAGVFHLMTHAFFKALLFLGSGSVIHAMAGEQDMRRMGDLKKYMPITFVTMMIGTLAIAGIPPFAGFFSKDEILFQAFVHNKPVWIIAVITAGMTAFYMFRLMAMTFFGAYRGPAWEAHHGAGPGHAAAVAAQVKDVKLAVNHGATHPADMHAHGHGHEEDHEVSHGPADDIHGGHALHAAHDDDHGGGHGHGPWHGPHESSSPMTFPLMALAVGAVLAGFVGVPAALGGGNAIEHFLEPAFTAEHTVEHAEAGRPEAGQGVSSEAGRGFSPAAAIEATPVAQGLTGRPTDAAAGARAQATAGEEETPGEAEYPRSVEIGLMLFSVLVAVVAIAIAWRFYVVRPDIAENLAERFAGAHRTLSNKYYVDELYQATVISFTFFSGRSLWTFDRNVVDGAVNGTGWLTKFGSWFSGLTDRTVVDGLVNLVGWVVQEGSYWFRRLQTGLVQNYALLMLFGVFAFVSIYLFVR